MEPLNQYFDIHSREHFISCHQICICHNQYILVCHFNVHIVPVWIAIILVSAFFSLFFFWFSPQQLTLSTMNSAFVHYSRSHKLHFSATFFIKNGSHSAIYTFKNYFATLFLVSVFSFSKNKLNPNIPIYMNKLIMNNLFPNRS